MRFPLRTGRSSQASRDGRPWRERARSSGAVLAIAVGVGLSIASTPVLLNGGPSPTRAAPDIGALPEAAPTPAETASAGPPHAPPVRLRIPRIAVDSVLTELQIQGDGHLAAPADPAHPGWWSRGPAPGSPGAAVIVGHVDSQTGPAVFYNLSALQPGDDIAVDEADGSTVRFTVRALRTYAKDAFPDALVYGPTSTPSLRLITCGGDYDHRRHEYLANLVIFAEPTAQGARSPSPSHSYSPSPGHDHGSRLYPRSIT